jgi:transcriptional regulator with GAF, ATPase, and Fis domain
MTEESKAEKFLELFNKGKEFTEELLRENQRLRYRVAALESNPATADEVRRLRDQLDYISDENRRLQEHYKEVEEQNNNLANLYVASYQLHSTLDFREVIEIVQEIIINLIGAEAFAILLLDEKTNELRTIAFEGDREMPGVDAVVVRVGQGTLGNVAKTGESYYLSHDVSGAAVSLDRPVAAVPLKIKDQVIGLIAVYKLLMQKDSFSAIDYELFSLLAAQAATAIFASKLYSQSERKLNTIQSFLELLTTS